MYYQIRTSVVNATAEQWTAIKKIEVRGIFSADVNEFLEVVGLVGSLTAKTTPHEKEFFDKLYAAN
jgi:hypothetical protein